MTKGERTTLIYGYHSVREALQARPEVIKKIFVADKLNDPELQLLVKRSGISIGPLPEAAATMNHQGLMALVDLEHLLQDYQEFINQLTVTKDTLLILLNELEDPQNVGAIIRSAAAFGAAAVLLPSRRQAPLSAAAIKASAGMAFRLPLVIIGNVNQTIEDLKTRLFWLYGLAAEAKASLAEQAFNTPTVLVFGNEGRGLRTKTKVHCDILVSIPLKPICESLNVAATAAIALYAWSQKKHR